MLYPEENDFTFKVELTAWSRVCVWVWAGREGRRDAKLAADGIICLPVCAFFLSEEDFIAVLKKKARGGGGGGGSLFCNSNV